MIYQDHRKCSAWFCWFRAACKRFCCWWHDFFSIMITERVITVKTVQQDLHGTHWGHRGVTVTQFFPEEWGEKSKCNTIEMSHSQLSLRGREAMVSIDWCINQVPVQRRLDLNLFSLYFSWTNQQSLMYLERAGLPSRNMPQTNWNQLYGLAALFSYSLVYAEHILILSTTHYVDIYARLAVWPWIIPR